MPNLLLQGRRHVCQLVAIALPAAYLLTETSKTQIDRLGDRLRRGEVADDDVRQLDDYRRSFAGAHEEVVGTIRNATELEPTGRPAKSTTSIVEKLRRETIRLSQMQDIAGCRLVVQDVLAQEKVVEQLKALLPSVAVVDRRKEPSNGYRAVHVIATAHAKPIEIQVRTELQHVWAQLSEKLSDTFDPAIKYGGGPTDKKILLMRLSTVLHDFEAVERMPDSAKVYAILAAARKELIEGLKTLIAGPSGQPSEPGS